MTEPWITRLDELLASQPLVLVSLTAIKGSAPRALGARMLVTGDGFEGSIGGGQFEYQALHQARALLADDSGTGVFCVRYGLGPALNQCCGGAVTLHFERFEQPGPGWLTEALTALAAGQAVSLLTPTEGSQPSQLANAGLELEPGTVRPETVSGQTWLAENLGEACLDVYIFGAGHVGRALISALQPHPFRLHWVDDRPGQFPDSTQANRIDTIATDPLAYARQARDGGIFIIMTHSHQLDEDLCHTLLEANRFQWLGLIGSETKALRFKRRLAQRGIDEQRLQRLVCPIGLTGISGKRPATIALSITAQLLSGQVPAQWQ